MTHTEVIKKELWDEAEFIDRMFLLFVERKIGLDTLYVAICGYSQQLPKNNLSDYLKGWWEGFTEAKEKPQ